MTIDLLEPVTSNPFATDAPRLLVHPSGLSGLSGSFGLFGSFGYVFLWFSDQTTQ